MKETITPQPTELFTSLSLQLVGISKASEILPIICLIERQWNLNTSKRVDYIIVNKILVNSIKYN